VLDLRVKTRPRRPKTARAHRSALTPNPVVSFNIL
jgi:hypothetical protein